MRYTEARMSKIVLKCFAILTKIRLISVTTDDSTEREPEVLPARIPNLLVNGATGIAVGMMTNIPHITWRKSSLLFTLLMKNPDVTTTELMEASRT